MATLPRPDPPRTAVIGRARQKELLTELLDIGSRSKRAAMLIGAPGAGKTTLLRWTFEQALELGRLTAFVRVPAAAGLPPRFPIGELLEGLVDSCDRLGMRTPDPLKRVLDTLKGTTSAEEYPAALPQIANALEVTAERAPLALFIDDYHSIPPDTAGLLLSALRVAECPANLIASIRHSPTHSVATVEPAADLWVDAIEVGSLSRDETRQLATEFLGGPVLPSLSEALEHHSGGNPLLAVETLRDWRTAGSIGRAQGFWGFAEGRTPDTPRSLRSLVEGRMRRLDAVSQRVLLVLSLLSRDTQLSELSRILGLSIDLVSNSIQQLEEEGFVLVAGESVSFAHPVHESCALDAHSGTQRARHHQKVFESLDPEIHTPIERAYHAVRAAVPPVNTLSLIIQAAQESESAGAYEEAAGWYQRLMDTSTTPERTRQAREGLARVATYTRPRVAIEHFTIALEEAGSTQTQAQLLLGRAEAYRVTGAFSDALTDLLAAQAVSDERLFDVHHRIAVLRGLAGDVSAALNELRRLESDAPTEDDRLAVKGHIGQALFVTGDLGGAHSAWIEVMKSSTRARDRDYVRANAAWAAVLLGSWSEAHILLNEALETASKAGDFWSKQSLHSSAVKFALWREDAAAAMDHAIAVERLASRIQNPVAHIEAAESMGIALVASDRPREAIPYLAAAVELGAATTEVREPVLTLCILGQAHLRSLATEAASRALVAARRAIGDMHFYEPVIRELAASLSLQRGDCSAALELLEDDLGSMPFLRGAFDFLAAKAFAGLGLWSQAESKVTQANSSLSSFGLFQERTRLETWWARAQPRRRGRPRSVLPFGITPRELEVLNGLSRGLRPSDVASDMFLSVETVRKYIQSARRKLGAPNSRTLVEEARRTGLIGK